MKQSLIHRGFFREMFRQLRAKGLVATLLLAGLNLIFFTAFLTRDPLKTVYTHYDARLMALPMLVILYVMVPIMVFGAYRWLNKRFESDFYHAIPLTRTQIYATTSAAVLAWLLIALGSFAVVQTILYTVFGLPFNYLLYLCVFLNMLIAAVEIVAAFSIGAALTGRRFAGFFQSLIVLFFPRLLLTAFWILVEIDAGFTVPFSKLPFFLNPEFNIAATPIHSLIWGINYANIPAMLYSLVYSFGLLLLGGVAFRKRKSELAEIPYASRVLQTAARVAFGMWELVSVVVTFNLYLRFGKEMDSIPPYMLAPMCVTSVLFSFLFYCLFELISTRKMKKVVKAMPAFGFCILLALIYIFVPNWVSKLHHQTVISAEEIRSYQISTESTLIMPSRIGGSLAYHDYLLEHYKFTNSEGKMIVAGQSKLNAKDQSNYILDNLTSEKALVNDGGLFRKTVSLNEYSGIFSTGSLKRACLKEPGFSDMLYTFPKGRITFTANGLTLSEAREVGRLFREDYEKLTDEQKQSLIMTNSSLMKLDTAFGAVSLSIKLFGSCGTENYTMQYCVNELTPNAAKAMLGYLNARNGAAAREQLKALVAWMEDPNIELDFYNFMIGTHELNIYGNLWYDQTERAATPRDGHPQEYAILKAMSEAPFSNDPEHAVTFRIMDYSGYMLTESFTGGAVGFAVDDETRALIEQWIGDNGRTPNFFSSLYDI